MPKISPRNEEVDYRLAFTVACALDILKEYSEKQKSIPQESRWLFAELAKVFADSLVGLDFSLNGILETIPSQLEIFLFMEEVMEWKNFNEKNIKTHLERAEATLKHFASSTEWEISQVDLEKTKDFLDGICDFLLEKAKAHVGLSGDNDDD